MLLNLNDLLILSESVHDFSFAFQIFSLLLLSLYVLIELLAFWGPFGRCAFQLFALMSRSIASATTFRGWFRSDTGPVGCRLGIRSFFNCCSGTVIEVRRMAHGLTLTQRGLTVLDCERYAVIFRWQLVQSCWVQFELQSWVLRLLLTFLLSRGVFLYRGGFSLLSVVMLIGIGGSCSSCHWLHDFSF